MMAVRHIAKEANRSTVQDKAKHRFPAGTIIEKARADLTADGYRCRDMPEERKTKAHVSCWPMEKRTEAVEKFLIGGNWRWDLYGDDGKVTKVHVSSARHGLHRKKPVPAKAGADPVVPASTATP
jgi:hypothetical protein